MDASPLLVSVLRALREQRLEAEAVMIGNAAAALHGGPGHHARL